MSNAGGLVRRKGLARAHLSEYTKKKCSRVSIGSRLERRPGMHANIATHAATESAAVMPALAVRDVARAIAFYQRAFAATVVTRTLGPDGNVVGAQLSINGEPLELTEATAGDGGTVPMKVDDVERWWRRAVTAGCAIVMPLGIGTGGLQGAVRDPFGFVWSLSGARARRRPCLWSNLG